MDGAKEQFLAALSRSRGIVKTACDLSGVSRSSYYSWRKADDEFRQRADDILEEQGDFVEGKLLENIEANDTTAIIFYLKTKGKHRGYTEKPLPSPAAPDGGKRKQAGEATAKRIRAKRDYIVRVLKKEGKYTAELSMQVGIVAQLLVRTELLAGEIFDGSHRAINVEYSREGNERESISPRERLYLDLLGQSQRALRALGMNTDAKERKAVNDGFADFLSSFKDEGE